MSGKLLQFINCRILRNHEIIKEDLWVRNGIIINPEKIFFDEKTVADEKIDCQNLILAPGFIELQINGGYGIDFSYNTQDVEKGINYVAQRLLAQGVTSFCPTIVTSPIHVYHKIISKIKPRNGDANGATVLGIHAEGPFLSKEKKGAHSTDYIQNLDNGFNSVLTTYGSLENIRIVTLAPELRHSDEVIKKLSDEGIVVSVGHSTANLKEGEAAVHNGATFITHLFNAMLPFHHRDPGLVGLLTSDNLPPNKTVYFGIIADGIHTHPAALRIAYRAHPKGLVLVTDAISAMGLVEGTHNIGPMTIEIKDDMAFIAGTTTLCGSVATMNQCVKLFMQATDCGLEYALEVASLHPAQVLGISDRKGTLDFGADADFIMLDDELNLESTWIAGECVYGMEL